MNVSRLQWMLLQITRKLWFRSALLSVLAVVSALLAVALRNYIPADMPTKIGAGAVDSILEIIATSMLAVTIFSLSTLVAALSAASTQVTPRAARLLAQDPTAHNALGTFLGAFIFSLVGIIALSTGIYGERGRVVLFAVTLLVILLIVVTLLRWIDHVSNLGRVADTTARVETAAAEALCDRMCHPWLGGQPLVDPIPSQAWALSPRRIGYVQHIDMQALDDLAAEHGLAIYIADLPGAFAEPSRPLARIAGNCSDEVRDKLRRAFTLDDLRDYDQDPRFGVLVMSEIAQRALSPTLNDPGTAIDVIGRQVRLLALWARPDDPPSDPKVRFQHVRVPAVTVDELFDDAFNAIARDGAHMVEVGLRLQKAFLALARLGGPRYLAAAVRHSRLALARAHGALDQEQDRQALARVAAEVAAMAGADAPGSRPTG